MLGARELRLKLRDGVELLFAVAFNLCHQVHATQPSLCHRFIPFMVALHHCNLLLLFLHIGRRGRIRRTHQVLNDRLRAIIRPVTIDVVRFAPFRNKGECRGRCATSNSLLGPLALASHFL